MIFGMMPLALGLGEGGQPARADGARGDRRPDQLDPAHAGRGAGGAGLYRPGRPVGDAALQPLGRRAWRVDAQTCRVIRCRFRRNSWHDLRYARAMPDDAPTIGLRVVESLSAVDAEQWDACALAPGSAGNPFLSHRFLKALEDSKSVGRRTGWQPQYLLAESRRRHPAGRRPALREGPQPGRIRLRPWLGAGLRARRRPLLSQAPGRRALHAGAGPAPVRAARSVDDGVRDAADRHAGQDRRRQPHQLGPRHLLHRGRLEALRRARLAAAAGPAVSLAQ